MAAKKIIGEKFNREFTIAKEAIDAEKRTVELSFSSEEAVPRWYGQEVLSHDPGACNLKRLQSRGPLLVDHDSRDQVGVIESCRIDSGDRKGRAIVRFSKSVRGNEIFQDVQDGIRTLVSVGYRVNKTQLVGKDGELETYRVLEWEPLEISMVSIPADTTVGVGRSEQSNNDTMTKPNFDAVAPPDTRGGGAPVIIPNVTEVRAEAAKAERERSEAIWTMFKQSKIPDYARLAQQAVKDDWTTDRTRIFIFEKMTNAVPLNLEERKPEIGMSEREVGSYSILRAMNLLANKRELDGLELEASIAVAKKTRRDPSGFFIPSDVLTAPRTRALNATTATQGGFTVGTDLQTGSMIELLRNSTVFNLLGARMLSGLIGNVAIPRVTGGGTAYWLNEDTAVTASTQAFGQLALTPHRLAGYTQYTKQLLSQSSIDVEGFVRNDLMTVLAIEKDRACINGLGAAGEPIGLLNTPSIGSVTFGAAATWAKVLSFESAVEVANAATGNIAYVTTPATKAKWKAALKVSAVSGFLWENGDIVNGYKAVSTNQVPSDKVIFGNFSDFVVADWDGIDVTVDPYSLSTQGLVKIVIQMLTDCGARHAVSFVASTDSGAQ